MPTTDLTPADLAAALARIPGEGGAIVTATDTEAALLAAVRANPGDIARRMVYADALADAGRELEAIMQRIIAEPDRDEWRLDYAAELERTAGKAECEACKGCGKIGIGNNGNPYMATCDECHGTGRVSDGRAELAEFVRVQVELAKWNPRDCNQGTCRTGGRDRPCTACREREELQAREHELWPAVRRAFAGDGVVCDIASGAQHAGTTLIIRRGLPAVVRCTLAGWMGGDCAACVGTGWTQASEPTSVMMPRCSQCQGKGEIPGIGPRLAQRWPVVAVEVADDPLNLPSEITNRFPPGQYTPDQFRSTLSDALIAWARSQPIEEGRS